MRKVVVAVLATGIFVIAGIANAVDLNSFGGWTGQQGQAYESYNWQGPANGGKLQQQGLTMGQSGTQTSVVSPNWNVRGCAGGVVTGENAVDWGAGGVISGNAGSQAAGAYGTQNQSINAANVQLNGALDLYGTLNVTKTDTDSLAGNFTLNKVNTYTSAGAVNESEAEYLNVNKNFDFNARDENKFEAENNSFGTKGIAVDGWAVGGVVAGDDFKASVFEAKKSEFEIEKSAEISADGSSGLRKTKSEFEHKDWNIANTKTQSAIGEFGLTKTNIEALDVSLNIVGALDYQNQTGGGNAYQDSRTCAGIYCNQTAKGVTP